MWGHVLPQARRLPIVTMFQKQKEKVSVTPLLGSYFLMPCCQSKSHCQGQNQYGKEQIEGENTGRCDPLPPLLQPSTKVTEISDHVPKPIYTCHFSTAIL